MSNKNKLCCTPYMYVHGKIRKLSAEEFAIATVAAMKSVNALEEYILRPTEDKIRWGLANSNIVCKFVKPRSLLKEAFEYWAIRRTYNMDNLLLVVIVCFLLGMLAGLNR